MLAWLFEIFVMTPFAAIQTGLCAAIGYGFYCNKHGGQNTNYWGVIIGCFLLLLLVNKIVRLIRFGGGTPFAYFFLDLLLAPIRLPLNLIINLIAFISIFTLWEVDAKEDPYIEDYGFFGCVLIYLFHVVPGRIEKRERTPVDLFDERRYKWINVGHQFLVLLLTLAHSMFTGAGISMLFLEHQDGHPALMLFIVLILIVAYVLLCWWSAELKGIRSTFDYYDNRRITRNKYKWNYALEDYERVSSEVVQEPGWKSFFTLPMFAYLVIGLGVCVQQLIVLILAIVIPAGRSVRPCRAKDVSLHGFWQRTIYFLFGVVYI